MLSPEAIDILVLQMHEMLKYVTSPTDFENACQYAEDVRGSS